MSRTVRACLPLCLLLLLAACAPAQSPPPVSASVPPAVSSPAEPDRSPPESSPAQEPEEPETPEEPKYDFSAPVPVNDPVENSYFEDAAFIGDSRTDGFLLYSGDRKSVV